MSIVGIVKQHGKPMFWSAVAGAALTSVVWAYNLSPFDRIASSADRIIPAASGMADGAANPDNLFTKICQTDKDEYKNGFMLVYDGHRQIALPRPEGGLALRDYEQDHYTCRVEQIN